MAVATTETLIALAGTIVSAAATGFTIFVRARSRERLAAIGEGGPSAQRFLADAVTSFNIDTKKISPSKLAEIVILEIQVRDEKHARLFRFLVVLVIILAIVTVALGVTGNAAKVSEIPNSLPTLCERCTPVEQKVAAQKLLVAGLRAPFENAHNPGDRKVLREQAPQVATRLLAIEENGLGPIFRVEKHLYAAFAFVMSAAGFDQRADRLSYLSRARDAAETAAGLIELLDQGRVSRAIPAELWDELLRLHDRDLLYYVAAVGLTLERREHQPIEACTILAYRDLIDPAQLRDFPWEQDPVLREVTAPPGGCRQ